MPSGRGWNDALARDTIEFFLEAIRGHARVQSVSQESRNVFVIERRDMPTVRAWVCDEYTLGIADYMNVRREDPEVDCIVTMSGYNRYTREAKDQGLEDDVGVFKFGELLGALNREGHEFVLYKKPT